MGWPATDKKGYGGMIGNPYAYKLTTNLVSIRHKTAER